MFLVLKQSSADSPKLALPLLTQEKYRNFVGWLRAKVLGHELPKI